MPKKYHHVPKPNPYSHEELIKPRTGTKKRKLTPIIVASAALGAAILKLSAGIQSFQRAVNNTVTRTRFVESTHQHDYVVFGIKNGSDSFYIISHGNGVLQFYESNGQDIIEYGSAEDFFSRWAQLPPPNYNPSRLSQASSNSTRALHPSNHPVPAADSSDYNFRRRTQNERMQQMLDSQAYVRYDIYLKDGGALFGSSMQYLNLADESDFIIAVTSDAEARGVFTPQQAAEIAAIWQKAHDEFNANFPDQKRPPLQPVEIDQASQAETIRKNMEELRKLQQLSHPRGR